jgi:hypothetical protein
VCERPDDGFDGGDNDLRGDDPDLTDGKLEPD